MVAAAPATRTVLVAGVPVQTTVTARPAIVRRWVHTTRWLLRLRRDPAATVVGLGVQWTPKFRAIAGAGVEPPATLQLCVGRRCLVFQIARARVPRVLRRFLADRSVTFAGYNVAADCRRLWDHHRLAVASTVELRRASGMGRASLEEMAERLLGVRGVSKPWEVGVSDWNVAALSKRQVRYACEDAYLSYQLGIRFLQNDEMSSSEASESEDSDY